MEERRKNYSQEIKESVNDALTLFYSNLPQNLHTKPASETLQIIGELRGDIKLIHEKLDGDYGIKKTLDTILEQTKRTNGRVNKLENWRNYIAGGLAILTLIGLPMCWMMINDVRELKDNKVISLTK